RLSFARNRFARKRWHFATLRRTGKIRHYGVSNLDLGDMQELWSVPGGPAVAPRTGVGPETRDTGRQSRSKWMVSRESHTRILPPSPRWDSSSKISLTPEP